MVDYIRRQKFSWPIVIPLLHSMSRRIVHHDPTSLLDAVVAVGVPNHPNHYRDYYSSCFHWLVLMVIFEHCPLLHHVHLHCDDC